MHNFKISRAGKLRNLTQVGVLAGVGMLVTLFGSNFRSLRDNFELSMVAADLKRKADSERGIIEAPLAGSDEPIKL